MNLYIPPMKTYISQINASNESLMRDGVQEEDLFTWVQTFWAKCAAFGDAKGQGIILLLNKMPR